MNDTTLGANVEVNLKGDLAKKTRKADEDFQRFAKNGKRHMGVLQRSAAGADRQINRLANRYIAFASGGAAVAVGKGVADLSKRLNQLGINAGKNGDALKRFKEDVHTQVSQAAADWGVNGALILDGLDAIIEKTGDVATATANIDNLGMAIAATGSSGTALGKLVGEFQKMGVVDVSGVLGALGGITAQGQKGAFTINEYSANSDKLFAAYGPKNVKQVLEMGAALQTIRKASGSGEDATTSFQALMNTLTDADKVKKLYSAGIEVFDEKALEDYRNGLGTLFSALLPVNKVMENIAIHTKGDAFVLSALIDDSKARDSLKALVAEVALTGEAKSIEALIDVGTDGKNLLEDAKDNAREVNNQLAKYREVIEGFAYDKLASGMERFADASGKIDVGRARAFLETMLDIGEASVKGIVAYKALRIAGDLRGASNRLRNPKSKGGATDAFSMASPLPVYVVNGTSFGGPGAGPGGAPPGQNPKTSKPRVGRIGRAAGAAGAVLGGAGQLAAAGAIGWEIGTMISAAIKGTTWDAAIGKFALDTAAFFGSDEAQAAVDRQNKYDKARRSNDYSGYEAKPQRIEVAVTGPGKIVNKPDDVDDVSDSMGEY